MLDLNLNPSPKELRWFGASLLALLAFVGWLVSLRAESWVPTLVIWAAGGLLAGVYYAFPRLRRSIYRGWMRALRPIGWTVSHAVFVGIYYMVVTPMAIYLRLRRLDPLHRDFLPEAETYWEDRRKPGHPRRYFRQF